MFVPTGFTVGGCERTRGVEEDSMLLAWAAGGRASSITEMGKAEEEHALCFGFVLGGGFLFYF